MSGVHHVVARLKRERDLRNVNLAAAARAVGIHAGVEVGDREHGQIGVGHHHALRQGSVHKGHAPARDGGHGGAGGSLRGARLERAGVERIGATLANGSMGLLACGTVGGIRCCHAHAVADSAGIFGRRGQRFLKGNALVAKGELHRLARTAVGNGKHAGIALAHDLLDARHKTVVRACDGRLLNLKLGRHRTAGTDEAHIVQALLGAKVELLGTHVQAVQTVDPRLAGTCLDILVGAQAIVEQRARLGQHHERLAAHVRQRAHGLTVHHRQKAVELRRDDARIHHLEQRRQLAVVLAGAVERHMHVVDGVVGECELATGEDLDAVLVADGLPRRAHHAADAVDLVAEKFNAHGRLFLRGKHLDGVAVHTEQAGRVGGAGIGVAHAHQTLRHLVKGNLLAHRKSSGLPVAALDRRHAAQQCAGRGDHDAVVPAHDAPERLAALGHHGVVGRLLAPRVVLALGKAAHVRQAHIGGQTACGAIGRILATHDVDRGARTTRKLGGRHERATRLRHGQRHVLARIESGLDGLQCLGSVELRGYTVNEHAVPPALQRQKPAGASSAGRSSNSLPVMVAHGEDSSSSVRPAPQQKRQIELDSPASPKSPRHVERRNHGKLPKKRLFLKKARNVQAARPLAYGVGKTDACVHTRKTAAIQVQAFHIRCGCKTKIIHKSFGRLSSMRSIDKRSAQAGSLILLSILLYNRPSGSSASKHLGPFPFRGIQTSDNANRIVAAARLDDPSVLFGKSRRLGAFVQNLGIGHMLPYKRLLLRAQQGLTGPRPQKRKYGLSRTRPRSKTTNDAREPFLSRLD